ncbi:MAG: hypothetical protein ABGY96_16125 [bacterium]
MRPSTVLVFFYAVKSLNLMRLFVQRKAVQPGPSFIPALNNSSLVGFSKTSCWLSGADG